MQKKRGGTIMKKKWIILPAAALLCGLFACVQITVVAPEEKTPNKADTEQVSITEVSGPEAPARAATKRCIYCGETIDVDSAFCIYCGKRV